MKKIIESSYILARQAIDKRRIIEQDETKLSKELQNNENSCIFPKDKIDIADITKQLIQSTDDRQVELTYSNPLKRISADIINKDGSRIEVKNENLPKELKEISDPKLFFTFLRNTYAKITELSDGEYKLYINHKLLGGSQEYLNTIKRLSCDLLMNKITPKQVLVELGVNDLKHTNDDYLLFRAVVLVTGFIWQGIENNSISINDVNKINFKRTFDSTVHHLESCQKRLNNIIKVTKDRLSLNISSEQALRELDVDHRKYSNIDDAILVISIKQVKEYTLQELNSSRINIDNINSTYFGRILDKIIYSKQEQLVNEASYDLLFHLDKGLEGLKNKIFNKEDPFTIHAVKYFFNSVNSTEASDTDIKGYLKREGFINFIYLKLQQQKFIVTFKEFIIQNKPTDSERNTYCMPKNGICHGSCLVSAKLEGDKLIQQYSFAHRDEILKQSSFLQQEYHNMRNPDNKLVYNLFIEKITDIIKTLDNRPPEHLIPKLLQEQNQYFLEFLKDQHIDQGSLYIQSVASLQEEALKNNADLQIFTNHDKVLSEESLTLKSFEIILEYLGNKLLNSGSANTKHIMLITLEDKSSAHDLIVRVDTVDNGYISRVIFSDLQDTGLYVIKATSNSTVLREASASSIELIKSYAKNLACNMFQIINAKYIEIG